MKNKLIILFLNLCFVTTAIHGTTYYVDATNGNDTATGKTTETPWKSLDKVFNTSFRPGDQILLKRGAIWRETLKLKSSGTADYPIVIGAYGSGNLPEINGADPVTEWTRNGDTGSIWKAPLGTQPRIVVFDGVMGTQKESIDSLQNEKSWYWDGTALYIYSEKDPATIYSSSGIMAGARNYAILIGVKYLTIKDLNLTNSNGNSATIELFKASNIYLKNITVTNSNLHGILLLSSGNCVIDSCTIIDVKGHGIYLRNSLKDYPCDNTIICGNTVTKSLLYGINTYGFSAENRIYNIKIYGNKVFQCGSGVYFHYTDDSEIYQNQLYENNNTTSSGEGQGIGLMTASNNKIYDNIIYNNRTYGIEVWGGVGPQYGNSDYNQIFRNRIYKNQYYGLKINRNYCDANQIWYNLIYNNSPSGAVLCTSKNAFFYNNTIWGNKYNGIYMYENTTGWTIKNNIIANNGKYELYASKGTEFTHSNNSYYNVNSARIFIDENVLTRESLSTFEPTGIFADPQLSDPDNHDFTVKGTSPCIDKGVDVGLTEDFRKAKPNQGNGVDIGAYEYEKIIPPSNLRVIEEK
jgi:parallel beta-helix repeat protein